MVAGSETERRTDRWPLTLAIRADFDQTIKPYLILLNPPSQGVLVGVAPVNAI